MTGFLIGLIVGGIFGIIIMAMMHIASDADRHMNEHDRHKKTEI